MLKKEISLQKELDVLTKNSFLLFYQFNNVSSSKWKLVKNEVRKEGKIDHLIFQNKTAAIALQAQESQQLEKFPLFKTKDILKDKRAKLSDPKAVQEHSKRVLPVLEKQELLKLDRMSIDKKIKNLLQGPTFVLGCETIEQLVPIHKLLKNFSNFLFIGGLYNNQFVTHYSIEKLFTLHDNNGAQTKIELIQFLNSKKDPSLFINLQYQERCLLLIQLMEKASKIT